MILTARAAGVKERNKMNKVQRRAAKRKFFEDPAKVQAWLQRKAIVEQNGGEKAHKKKIKAGISLYNSKATINSRELKKRATSAEKFFRAALQKAHVKHKFQKYFYDSERCFIVDFFFKYGDRKLIIELDGEYHNDPKQKAYDAYRENWLINKRGCEVWRYTNDAVFKNAAEIILRIRQFQKRPPA